jgi:hypothetical protein
MNALSSPGGSASVASSDAMMTLIVSSDRRIKETASGVQLAVAELAEHVLGSVRHVFQARQAEKAARSLDGVDKPKDVVQQLRGVGILL